MSGTNPRLADWLAKMTPDAPIYAALYTGEPEPRTEPVKLPPVFASGESFTFDPAAVTAQGVAVAGVVIMFDQDDAPTKPGPDSTEVEKVSDEDLRDRLEALSESDRVYVFGWLVNAALATVEGRRELRQAMDAAHASRKGEK